MFLSLWWQRSARFIPVRQQRIGELVGDRRLEKYCVWLLAALVGMPFVVQVSGLKFMLSVPS